jgi:hypothetical protein
MVRRRTALTLALMASLAAGLPAGAAQAQSSEPIAHAAGGDAPPLTPSIVAVPLARAEQALGNAADAVDASNGADAIAPLTSARRNMIRAYNGAKYLIAQTPAAPPAEDRRATQRFVKLARQTVRDSHSTGKQRSWILAQASQFAPPVLADTPTAVFGVFTGQYNVATTAAGMIPDVQGDLLARAQNTLATAVQLRNRLVQLIATAAPPAPAADLARTAQDEEVTTFDVVMPGVSVLLGDEIQQLTQMGQDTSIPAASSAAVGTALAADQQILTQVNTVWPPVADD